MKHYRLHCILMTLVRYIVTPVIKSLFKYSCEKVKLPDRPSIIIANHNSNLDPAMVSLGLRKHFYFLASEHAFRMGLVSLFLKFVFAPIPFNKVKADPSSLKDMLARVKAGYSVCLFAEGNRSYNGLTGHIPFSTAKLVKMSGGALITYRLEGGFLSTPRWAKKRRKGKMEGRVVGQYSAEEIKSMSANEVYSIIKRDIHEDAYQRQKLNPIPYRGEDLAEHIEIALYMCPLCKKTGTIQSRGDSFFCGCGLSGLYTETGFLEGENLPFSTIAEWDQWQAEQFTAMVRNAGDEPICMDKDQKLFLIKPLGESILVEEGLMQINKTELKCASQVFLIQNITRYAVVDRMTLTFALSNGAMYEVRSGTPRNVLKYIIALRVIRNENE